MTAPEPTGAESAVSEDALLGGRITIAQPLGGYRAAIDPVFLAAAVPAQAGESVLDVGIGAGAAALCLAARVGEVRVAGIDLQRDLVRLAVRNAAANGLGRRVDFMVGDLVRAPKRLAPGSFHHVMANPPYLADGHGNRPVDDGKAAANVEGGVGLDEWMRFALMMVRPKGTVTLIHRADRLEHVLAACGGRLGGIKVYPLWPGPRGASKPKPAKRVIVQGRKGVGSPLTLLPGLVLHESGGGFTREADAVLRGAEGLVL